MIYHNFLQISGVTQLAQMPSYLASVTSNVQDQLDNKAALSHNHEVTSLTSWPSGLTATELGYISTVTSNVQDQIDAISGGGGGGGATFRGVFCTKNSNQSMSTAGGAGNAITYDNINPPTAHLTHTTGTDTFTIVTAGNYCIKALVQYAFVINNGWLPLYGSIFIDTTEVFRSTVYPYWDGSTAIYTPLCIDFMVNLTAGQTIKIVLNGQANHTVLGPSSAIYKNSLSIEYLD